MLTKGVCADWAKFGLQVNGLGPGYFETELTRTLVDDAEFSAWLCKRTPAGRWGRMEELGGAMVFLAAPASGFVNGQVIYVDGGLTSVVKIIQTDTHTPRPRARSPQIGWDRAATAMPGAGAGRPAPRPAAASGCSMLGQPCAFRPACGPQTLKYHWRSQPVRSGAAAAHFQPRQSGAAGVAGALNKQPTATTPPVRPRSAGHVSQAVLAKPAVRTPRAP